VVGADQLPMQVRVVDGELPMPTKAPTVGQHTDEVLRDLGYDDEQIAALRADGVLGDT
jgi:crotonobetainyl-CoA:carnitine CoA-transferase CaiB-like acyl-CoA transferase